MPGIYRADHVGSLLRPDEVKQARASFQASASFNEGSINAEQLREVEDKAVLAALGRQKSIGIDVFTDGDFLVIPSWAWHEHAAAEGNEAILFSIQDTPIMKSMALYREEPYIENGGNQPVTSHFQVGSLT